MDYFKDASSRLKFCLGNQTGTHSSVEFFHQTWVTSKPNPAGFPKPVHTCSAHARLNLLYIKRHLFPPRSCFYSQPPWQPFAFVDPGWLDWSSDLGPVCLLDRMVRLSDGVFSGQRAFVWSTCEEDGRRYNRSHMRFPLTKGWFTPLNYEVQQFGFTVNW